MMRAKLLNMDLTLDSQVVSSPSLASADLGEGEVIVLHLSNGQYFGLHDVSARIWKLVESPITVREIERVMLEEYEIENERCHEEVSRLLHELIDEGIVEVLNPRSASSHS